MEEFPANSHKAKGPNKSGPPVKKEVKAVVQNEAVRRKKPLGKRFAENFVGGDAKGAIGYVIFEVMIPAAKDMVLDAFTEGLEKTLFGETRGGSSRRRRGGSYYGGPPSAVYTAYNRITSGPSGPPPPWAQQNTPDIRRHRGSRANFDIGEPVCATRAEAQEVIDEMFTIISQYEQVTVADLYGLLNWTSEFTDENFGWTDIRGAGVTRTRNGMYAIELPPPVALD